MMNRRQRLAYLNKCACFVQANSTKLFLTLILSLVVLCVAIKSVKFDANLNNWIQSSPRINDELQYMNNIFLPNQLAPSTNAQAAAAAAATISSNNQQTTTTPTTSNSKLNNLFASTQNPANFNPNAGVGSYSQLLIQTPANANKRNYLEQNILHVDSFMYHLEAMAIATHITIDLYDVTWSLKELCFRPTLPNLEGFHVSTVLDRMMPCTIKTPLDCFWEGSKLHETPSTPSLGMQKWTSLDPIMVVEHMQRSHPHASFDYDSLLTWMRRVGIKHGYQRKPCLDPTDPNCPETAPNKFDKLNNFHSNIGAILTGGCNGIAENQMHWHEEELLGGIVRNKSGHIIKASALQSSIPLMGEQDMYDYWKKTEQTQDINNWSTDKAKHILETWQMKFKEELAQFTRTSILTNNKQKIHAMTSKLMLEPIDLNLLLDYSSFLLSQLFMTILTCITFPSFARRQKEMNQTRQKNLELNNSYTCRINRFKLILLALMMSLIVGLTFIASLGLSSILDLTFNMATTQILPPLALYYGFNQLNIILRVYSQKFGKVPVNKLTVDCLNELIPIIFIEFITYLLTFSAAAIIPIPATRILASQAIIYILTATFVGIVLIPAILSTFLSSYHFDVEVGQDDDLDCGRSTSSCSSRKSLNVNFKKKSVKQNLTYDLESDEIFSRIQDDLKKIQAGPRVCTPTDLNFSAHFDGDGLKTMLNITTSRHNSYNSNRHRVSQNQQQQDNYNHGTTDIKNNELVIDPNLLPDLLTSSSKPSKPVITTKPTSTEKIPVIEEETKFSKIYSNDSNDDEKTLDKEMPLAKEDLSSDDHTFSIFKFYNKTITSNNYVKLLICVIQLSILVALLPYVPKVKYGIQLKDIISQGTEEYDSFSVQEKYFPIYNVFAITKGNFDYPTNQRLLHEYYKSIERVDGIIKDDSVTRFWLFSFRDWLLDIQRKFDIDKNNSFISKDGWTADASDSAKLGYKLLVQTGRSDNPIDRSQVETNRLVDANGIINPRAFYHYLTAWVSCDAFVYSTSEANFKPEPKIMNDNPDNLKIEKARPLTYVQIPFLMKLSSDQDSVKTISEIRSITQAFEQLNLPNFPTGIPFIFWDQFFNLDLLVLMTSFVGTISIFFMMIIINRDVNIAAIITIPLIITELELYSIMGYLTIPFNNILAVLLISSVGVSLVQTVYYTTYFVDEKGDLLNRTSVAIRRRFSMVMSSSSLFLVCIIVFYNSKIDFLNKYSYLLLCLLLVNLFNSILLTPVILVAFGSKYRFDSNYSADHQEVGICKKDNIQRGKSIKVGYVRKSEGSNGKGGSSNGSKSKKSGYPRKIQSEISLSTISEESHTEAPALHDLRFDLSIRCY